MKHDYLKMAKIYTIPAETVILQEGEINLDMYKIVKGNVELYVGYGTPNETLIGILGPQECFGEFGLLLQKPAIYTVVAYSEVLLVRITEGEIGDFVQQNHKNIIDIMRNMASVMLTMSTHIKMLLLEIEEGNKPDPEEIYELRLLQKSLRRQAFMHRTPPIEDAEPKMRFLNRRKD